MTAPATPGAAARRQGAHPLVRVHGAAARDGRRAQRGRAPAQLRAGRHAALEPALRAAAAARGRPAPRPLPACVGVCTSRSLSPEVGVCFRRSFLKSVTGPLTVPPRACVGVRCLCARRGLVWAWCRGWCGAVVQAPMLWSPGRLECCPENCRLDAPEVAAGTPRAQSRTLWACPPSRPLHRAPRAAPRAWAAPRAHWPSLRAARTWRTRPRARSSSRHTEPRRRAAGGARPAARCLGRCADRRAQVSARHGRLARATEMEGFASWRTALAD